MATNISQDVEKERAVAVWRNKTEASKKGEIPREIQKLKVQIQAMEREKCTHLYSRRSDFREDFSQLEELDNKATAERKAEQIKLKQQLEKISHMVKRFHKELRDMKPTPEFVEKLKVIMEEIEGTINAFKDQQRKKYEEILLEEKTTWLEIQMLEKKFDSWSQLTSDTSATKQTTVNKPLASARDITKDLPPEVAAFEKFMEQNGGMRGGWDEYDHQTFLKFRQRYQELSGQPFITLCLGSIEQNRVISEPHYKEGKPIFLSHVLPAIPTRTEEEIREHEEWYQEYLFLNETKKDAIKKWKEKREFDKDELLAKASKEEEEVKDEKKEKLKEQIEQERRERKTQLNAWKVQKELEKAQKEERKLREELEKHKKQEDWKKKQELMKAQVDQYRQQKQEEEEFIKQQEALWEEEERERKKQISSREITKFRMRDDRVLQSKLAKDKAKQEEQKEKEKRLEKLKQQVDIEVERDPNRLLKPTEGWRNRARDKTTSGGQVLHMPHRAIPSWRQGP